MLPKPCILPVEYAPVSTFGIMDGSTGGGVKPPAAPLGGANAG